jgi:polyisoprenoid-binding protein YceI
MKHLILFLLIISFPTFSQQKFDLNQKESTIFWKGGLNAAGFGGHEGVLKLKSGNLSTDLKGKLAGGTFEIDMNSITNTDIKQEKSQHELEDHLKNTDFFDVKKYPVATFKIVKILPGKTPNNYSIQGDFAMKGITNRIFFPAIILQEKDKITAKGELMIYRSQWGITYKNGTQWLGNMLNNMKNDLIADEIMIKLDLVFLKGK